MKIETCIDSLVAYAMNTGLAEPVDHQVLTNRLLDLLHREDYAPSDELLSEDLEEILAGILDYACAHGLCEDNITARDIFDTRIMGALTPMPREVIRCFREKYAQSPREATDWYYKFSCDTDYTASPRICAGPTKVNTGSWTSPSTSPSPKRTPRPLPPPKTPPSPAIPSASCARRTRATRVG